MNNFTGLAGQPHETGAAGLAPDPRYRIHYRERGDPSDDWVVRDVFYSSPNPQDAIAELSFKLIRNEF